MSVATQPESPVAPTRRPLPAHLKRLEAESIAIIREVAAEFENPVMLYSIGKDSGVMLHLAVKAFFPSKPPFPLLQVDTTWEFRHIIPHRDSIAELYCVKLLIYLVDYVIRLVINPIGSLFSLLTKVLRSSPP